MQVQFENVKELLNALQRRMIKGYRYMTLSLNKNSQVGEEGIRYSRSKKEALSYQRSYPDQYLLYLKGFYSAVKSQTVLPKNVQTDKGRTTYNLNMITLVGLADAELYKDIQRNIQDQFDKIAKTWISIEDTKQAVVNNKTSMIYLGSDFAEGRKIDLAFYLVGGKDDHYSVSSYMATSINTSAIILPPGEINDVSVRELFKKLSFRNWDNPDAEQHIKSFFLSDRAPWSDLLPTHASELLQLGKTEEGEKALDLLMLKTLGNTRFSNEISDRFNQYANYFQRYNFPYTDAPFTVQEIAKLFNGQKVTKPAIENGVAGTREFYFKEEKNGSVPMLVLDASPPLVNTTSLEQIGNNRTSTTNSASDTKVSTTRVTR